MSKSILVDKDILYSRLDRMIDIAENNSTSKKGIARMKEQRNNIHHAIQDTTELLEALEKYKMIPDKHNVIGKIDNITYNKLYKVLGGTNEKMVE